MNNKFETKDGMFIVKADGKTFYMRSHPKTMLSSMRLKKHDKFMAFIYPDEYKKLGTAIHAGVEVPSRLDVTLGIEDLIRYIAEVE